MPREGRHAVESQLETGLEIRIFACCACCALLCFGAHAVAIRDCELQICLAFSRPVNRGWHL